MVVRLRLARYGRRNLPYYSIVAANAKTARNAKPLETIGTYNPIPDGQGIKHVNLNVERVKYWLTVGAQPSETVERLLSKVYIIIYLIIIDRQKITHSISQQPEKIAHVSGVVCHHQNLFPHFITCKLLQPYSCLLIAIFVFLCV